MLAVKAEAKEIRRRWFDVGMGKSVNWIFGG